MRHSSPTAPPRGFTPPPRCGGPRASTTRGCPGPGAVAGSATPRRYQRRVGANNPSDEGNLIMKKSIAKKTASVSHTLLAQVQPAGVTDPVPTTLAPSPPPGYVATKIGRGGNSILRSQVAIASKAAGELTNSTTYAKLGDAVRHQA